MKSICTEWCSTRPSSRSPGWWKPPGPKGSHLTSAPGDCCCWPLQHLRRANRWRNEGSTELGCIHSLWAGTNLPVELSVTRIRCIPVAVSLHHFTPLSENHKWRCEQPLHAQTIAIRKGHMGMFPPSSPLLHSEVLPEPEWILDSSGGAALLFCNHDEEILCECYVPLNQSENVSWLHYKVGIWWTTSDWFLLWMRFTNTWLTLINYLTWVTTTSKLQDFFWHITFGCAVWFV